MLRKLTTVTALAIVVFLAALAAAGSATASRAPTSSERGSLTQAAFDTLKPPLVGAGATAGRIHVTGIRVATLGARFPTGVKFVYRWFAAVDVFSPTSSGAAVLLFGYYVTAGVSGWRLLSGPGSSNVGCDVPVAVFQGFKTAVLRDLRLTCS